jgi:hypothetical protein
MHFGVLTLYCCAVKARSLSGKLKGLNLCVWHPVGLTRGAAEVSSSREQWSCFRTVDSPAAPLVRHINVRAGKHTGVLFRAIITAFTCFCVGKSLL